MSPKEKPFYQTVRFRERLVAGGFLGGLVFGILQSCSQEDPYENHAKIQAALEEVTDCRAGDKATPVPRANFGQRSHEIPMVVDAYADSPASVGTLVEEEGMTLELRRFGAIYTSMAGGIGALPEMKVYTAESSEESEEYEVRLYVDESATGRRQATLYLEAQIHQELDNGDILAIAARRECGTVQFEVTDDNTIRHASVGERPWLGNFEIVNHWVDKKGE